MAKLIEKTWNWGHLEGSHNFITGINHTMSPEQFMEEYGVPNAFIVSYAGNIQPPFDSHFQRFAGLKQIKWSVLGDASTPLPEARLGETQTILDCVKKGLGKNLTGGVLDDFFSPERMKRFTPEVLKEIKAELNANGLDFWCVLYNHQLDLDLAPYMECFDGVSFWLWGSEHIENLEDHLAKFFKVAEGKQKMLGMYLWDYLDEGTKPMDGARFEKQLHRYFGLLENGEIEGVIFCSSTVADGDLEANKILKKFLKENGDKEIKK